MRGRANGSAGEGTRARHARARASTLLLGGTAQEDRADRRQSSTCAQLHLARRRTAQRPTPRRKTRRLAKGGASCWAGMLGWRRWRAVAGGQAHAASGRTSIAASCSGQGRLCRCVSWLERTLARSSGHAALLQWRASLSGAPNSAQRSVLPAAGLRCGLFCCPRAHGVPSGAGQAPHQVPQKGSVAGGARHSDGCPASRGVRCRRRPEPGAARSRAAIL